MVKLLMHVQFSRNRKYDYYPWTFYPRLRQDSKSFPTLNSKKKCLYHILKHIWRLHVTESLKPVMNSADVSISQMENIPYLLLLWHLLSLICTELAEKSPSLRDVLTQQYSQLDTDAEVKRRLESYALHSK